MQTVFEDIKNMLKANFPLLYLATSEYSRVTQKLRSIAFAEGYKFNTWDCVDGLQEHLKDQNNRLKEVKQHPNHSETQGFAELLNYIRNGLIKSENNSEPEIFILEDFHKYFQEDTVIVYLRKLSNELKFFNKHIILLSPFYKLPDEIEKYVTVVNVPLPDKNDLKIRLNYVLDKNQKINEDLEKYVIDAALGLTDTEADLAFRLAKQTGIKN